MEYIVEVFIYSIHQTDIGKWKYSSSETKKRENVLKTETWPIQENTRAATKRNKPCNLNHTVGGGGGGQAPAGDGARAAQSWQTKTPQKDYRPHQPTNPPPEWSIHYRAHIQTVGHRHTRTLPSVQHYNLWLSQWGLTSRLNHLNVKKVFLLGC